MESHEKLIAFLNEIRKFSTSEKDDVHKYFVPKSIKKGEFIGEYSKESQYMVFVRSGYCRVYVIDLDGNEVTIHLAGNVDFVGSIRSFLGRRSSDEYIQAVTDVEILMVSYENLQKLFDSSWTWDRVGRVVTENMFIRKQSRVTSFIIYTAEERYAHLMEEDADILLYVPMQYVASYLGVTPETLSRIRSRIS